MAQRFRQHKHVLRLSNHSFELMMAFLVEKKHYLVLSLINQYVDIRGKQSEL